MSACYKIWPTFKLCKWSGYRGSPLWKIYGTLWFHKTAVNNVRWSTCVASRETRMENPVVVIGAGFCGIAALKIALDYKLNVICYEKSGDIGGLWRYREEDIDGVASVMKSTIIDTSKEMEAFSDFPVPEEFANYMHNSLIIKYLEMYVDHFQVRPHIRLHHEVLQVQKANNFGTTGEWDVHIKNNKTGEESKVKASAVMVCNGHHVYPHLPDFPGLSDFKGYTMHSHSYKDFHKFENKKVVVVGIGNSGADIAVDLSRVCPELYLSTRRGCWIAPRLAEHGIPFDALFNTRFQSLLSHLLPDALLNHFMMKKLNARFDHSVYNLKPKHKPLQQQVTMSEELPCRISAGAVTIKGNIHSFTENGVRFVGEEHTEYPIDAVIFATGYDIKFPFIPEEVIKVFRNRCLLYRRVIPMTIEHPTLAVIGLLQPQGAFFAMAEMQSRWAISVFLKQINLPTREQMILEQTKHQGAIDEKYVDSYRHSLLEDYVPYMDKLAKDFKVKPNILKYFLTDPRLFWQIYFGPLVAYQYRLQGPHSWPGARDAILTTWDRMYAPFATNKSLLRVK